MGKTVFNLEWLTQYGWVRECKDDPHKVKCFTCWKIIDLGKMGENALKSYMNSVKHKSNNEMLEGLSNMHLFTTASSSTGIKLKNYPKRETLANDSSADLTTPDILNIELPQPSTGTEIKPSRNSMLHFATRNDVFEAEILWTFKTVCHIDQMKMVPNYFAKCFRTVQLHRSFLVGRGKQPICVYLESHRTWRI